MIWLIEHIGLIPDGHPIEIEYVRGTHENGKQYVQSMLITYEFHTIIDSSSIELSDSHILSLQS